MKVTSLGTWASYYFKCPQLTLNAVFVWRSTQLLRGNPRYWKNVWWIVSKQKTTVILLTVLQYATSLSQSPTIKVQPPELLHTGSFRVSVFRHANAFDIFGALLIRRWVASHCPWALPTWTQLWRRCFQLVSTWQRRAMWSLLLLFTSTRTRPTFSLSGFMWPCWHVNCSLSYWSTMNKTATVQQQNPNSRC